MVDPTATTKIDKLARRIRDAGGLPVFDSTLQHILGLIRDGAAMADIAAAVDRDPGLAARVLKLANSAYYGMSREVSTLKMALVLLGSRSLKNMVLSIGLVEVLEETSEGDAGYPGAGFRSHSFACGQVASVIARTNGIQLHGEEFVAGLVHDVGKLVLLRAFPERVGAELARLSTATPTSLLDLEEELFGLDHADAGAWAAESWSLPDPVVQAIAHHHSAPTLTDVPELTAVVRAAETATSHPAGDDDTRPEAWEAEPLLAHVDVGAVLRAMKDDAVAAL